MKKRILSILITLCMVLMLVPATAFADENYMITQNFKYGTLTYDGTDPQTSPYQFVIPAGGSFSLATIEDCAPYELVGWKETGSGTVYPPYGEIQNLQSDLTFDAVYQVQGGLTITVDGFMPGKKVGDCTYTVESTIPGVEFSETDILDIQWSKYNIGGDWSEAHKFDVFQAGTGYGFVITLSNNDLELVPSTTVNGIAPRCSEIMSNNGVPYAINIECDLGTLVAPTLAVTVDNFEVGKTPKDIEYSFASTNLGVTFSEEDILANTGGWKYYHGEADEWLPMSNTEVFEAGTRYWCTINLDNKGLTVAPAVTVNGKTPEVCYLATRVGTPYALLIGCEFGTPPEPALTISGPDVVCAEQDYEFSATASEGAAISYFQYRCGESGGDTGWSRIEDGVYYGTVPASEYGDADTLALTVTGTAANGKPATATKTVQISKEHIFVDGVCACGAAQQYEIAYMSAGTSEDSIPSGVKTHGVDFTLSSETFTRDGYVQTGWMDEYGTEYELGGFFTLDEDMMFFPVFEKLVTVTADFTTTVALGDAGKPGEKTFTLALIGDSAPDKDKSNVSITGSVTTNGKGSYNGTLTFTGTERTLWVMLSEGAFVQQVDDGEAGWTVDDTVWGVLMEEIPFAYAMGDDATASGYTVYVVPASIDGNGDYTIDWENLQAADMAFTNTYTAHDYALKHDATHHWDECACKDVQNKELHKYGDWKVTKEATQTAVGEKEHTCTICGYTETAEIAKLPATTDPTKPDTETKSDTTSPQTGDNSHMALWFALLCVSGSGVIGTTVYGRKKRAK